MIPSCLSIRKNKMDEPWKLCGLRKSSMFPIGARCTRDLTPFLIEWGIPTEPRYEKLRDWFQNKNSLEITTVFAFRLIGYAHFAAPKILQSVITSLSNLLSLCIYVSNLIPFPSPRRATSYGSYNFMSWIMKKIPEVKTHKFITPWNGA